MNQYVFKFGYSMSMGRTMLNYVFDSIVNNMNTEFTTPSRFYVDGVGKLGPGFLRFLTYADEVKYNINNPEWKLSALSAFMKMWMTMAQFWPDMIRSL